MAKNIVIAVLAAATLILGNALVRVENERYALLFGLCRKGPVVTIEDFDCLENVQSRTSSVWHLYFAVFGD